MTAILWKNNELLVDSATFNGLEWVDVGDKVSIVRNEVFVSTDETDPGDPILAMTYTGAKAPAMAVMTLLTLQSHTVIAGRLSGDKAKHSTKGRVKVCLSAAGALDMLNAENSFTVLLIGLINNYVVGFDDKTGDVKFDTHPKSEELSLGSASIYMDAVKRLCKEDIAPSTQLMLAMSRDALSGGRVYGYKVSPTSRSWCGHEMYLAAVYEPPCNVARAKMEAAPGAYVVTPDLITNRDAEAEALRTEAGIAADSDYARYLLTFESTTTEDEGEIRNEPPLTIPRTPRKRHYHTRRNIGRRRQSDVRGAAPDQTTSG